MKERARLLGIRALNYVTNHLVNHVPSYGIRHAWYERLGVSLGPRSAVQMGCYLWFYGPGQLRRGGLTVGERTKINRGCCLDGRGRLVIGNDVSVSADVAIITTQHQWRAPGFVLESRDVVIEDHVWIGMRATILPGTTIGRGAVVAAGAVVSGTVPPMTVVAGVPARPVAERPAQALEYALDGPVPLFE